ncbi:chloride channel protein [Marinomonas epiphytica]
MKGYWSSRFYQSDDLYLLSLLGAVCGVVSSCLIALLYFLVYLPLSQIMIKGGEDFESLSLEWRVALPVASCILLMLLFSKIPPHVRKVGIPYVVERFNYHQGNLPWRNAVVQFFGAIIGLVGGLSIGKEGPTVHIGATLGAKLAGWKKLPQHGVETLLACGVAGGIAACFQTPLAGVLFAFEVILLEYRTRYVLPILLSAVVATHLSQLLIGSIAVVSVSGLSLSFITPELFGAYLSLVVFIIFVAGVFSQTQRKLWLFEGLPIWLRFSLVMLATVLVAVYIPEALGSSFDSLDHLLSGEAIAASLFILILVKVGLSALTLGLGIPGGMIGPAFVIGALAGIQVALFFNVADSVEGGVVLFALLGMAAMMATCFQAPLTALLTVVEMTHTSEVIAPALFVIVLSCLLSKLMLKQESIFVSRLSYMGLSGTFTSIRRYLRHQAVAPLSDPVQKLKCPLPLERMKSLAATMVEYCAYEKDGRWHIVKRSSLLEVLESLAVGPQPWLAPVDDSLGVDIGLATQVQTITCIEEPESLETMLAWFQQHASAQVLILSKDSTMCLLSRRQLDEALLEGSVYRK